MALHGWGARYNLAENCKRRHLPSGIVALALQLDASLPGCVFCADRNGIQVRVPLRGESLTASAYRAVFRPGELVLIERNQRVHAEPFSTAFHTEAEGVAILGRMLDDREFVPDGYLTSDEAIKRLQAAYSREVA